MKSFIPLLFLPILFCSCEDPIQVKIDEGNPLVTIDAFIDNMRKQQTIRLTYADNYFSQKPSEGIKGATVIVKDNTTGLSYPFVDNNNGNYSYSLLAATDTLIRLGHEYELQVSHQGNYYSALSTANRSTTVDSIIFNYSNGDNFIKAGYDAGFLGVDPAGPVSDYYWIKSYRNGVFFNKGIDINICVDGAYSEGADGFIFIPPIARGILPRGSRINKNDTLQVEIHSISKTCYNFLNQVFTQTTNSGLFATSPENVKTNITTSSKVKAVGWFNTSMVGWKKAKVE